jgi:dihydrofolate synthase/folylpolyglutamate synthase
VRPPHPRGLDPEEVAAVARRLGIEAEAMPSISSALESARVLAGENGFILVTGSLYVVGEARQRLH